MSYVYYNPNPLDLSVGDCNLFAIETDRHSYVFSGYEISEYYEVGEGLVKVVCIK